MKRAIVIMAKVPRPGNVKTRLAGVLSPEGSAELAAAFIKDTVAKTGGLRAAVTVAFDPPEDEKAIRALLTPDIAVFGQTGADLGDRVTAAFDEAFRNHGDVVVMVGTDSPTVPADYFEQAFEHLELETEVVLGGTTDGGFYLIGLRAPHPEIFAGVRWSSSTAFEDVYQNAMSRGLHLREVPSWYDVDTPADLAKLVNELEHNSNAKRRAPETLKVLGSRE